MRILSVIHLLAAILFAVLAFTSSVTGDLEAARFYVVLIYLSTIQALLLSPPKP